MKVSVVIAAYNEAAHIDEVVRSVARVVDEVIVVDDCSQDTTAKLAAQAGAKVLSLIVNRGQGAALRLGVAEAVNSGADIIVHFDGDGQFLPEEIAQLIQPIIDGQADVCLGSRFLQSSGDLPFSKRYLLHPLARLVNFLFWRVRYSDPQCGFRAFTAAAAAAIIWRQDRMAHASEILALLQAGNWRVKEVPVTVRYEEYGQGLGGGIKIIKELFLKYLTDL